MQITVYMSYDCLKPVATGWSSIPGWGRNFLFHMTTSWGAPYQMGTRDSPPGGKSEVLLPQLLYTFTGWCLDKRVTLSSPLPYFDSI